MQESLDHASKGKEVTNNCYPDLILEKVTVQQILDLAGDYGDGKRVEVTQSKDDKGRLLLHFKHPFFRDIESEYKIVQEEGTGNLYIWGDHKQDIWEDHKKWQMMELIEIIEKLKNAGIDPGQFLTDQESELVGLSGRSTFEKLARKANLLVKWKSIGLDPNLFLSHSFSKLEISRRNEQVFDERDGYEDLLNGKIKLLNELKERGLEPILLANSELSVSDEDIRKRIEDFDGLIEWFRAALVRAMNKVNPNEKGKRRVTIAFEDTRPVGKGQQRVEQEQLEMPWK